MKSAYLLVAPAVVLALSSSAAAQSTAIIQGVIVDSATGKAVPGAVVMASSSTPVARGVATSAYDGSFQIPSLPAGSYNLCVQFPQDGYLPTCHWGIAATTVMLAAGQKSTGNKLGVKAGSVLKIHVADPGQLLSQKTKDGTAPHLATGVWSAGIFYAARATSQSAASVDYQVTVPFDTNLNFSIQSRNLVIGDARGVALGSSGDQQSFSHLATAPSNTSFTYTILSAK